MGRNIDKTVKAYQEWKKKNANKGDFFCEDFKQIYEISFRQLVMLWRVVL